ncbi:hypothetical protein [Natrinema sp. 1APR25-10V2]|uniref:DUF7350 domain-containing protein n=1 Tax=Natrinema sp. 1APR25-10V2 TaxID=2951081 RepID=UPI002874F2A1|nr:hypothetical protein [Natrinema sp. 1APR25-10V2]MDS0477433.1 hypothetical protein [Natrinema sp. 1APR25-10V2]
MNRRTALRRMTALSGAIVVAGCAAPSGERNESDDGETGTEGDESVTGTSAIPRIDDPPQAVYLPGHRKSMRVLEPIDAGDYRLAPMLTYPHPFWIVTGAERQLVEPEAGRGVHLMCTVWDSETGTVVPVDIGPRVTLERTDGGDEWRRTLSPWPMLSQEMGVHFGDNVALPADGTYAATVELPPVGTRRTGSFENRFTDRATATFEFTYDEAFREAVVDGVELLVRERWGKRGALEAMLGQEGRAAGDGSDGDGNPAARIPYSALPPAADYPGTRLVEPSVAADAGSADGLPTSGDAAFVVTLLEPGSRLADSDDRYLLVSPRTPYNRVPLANTSLRAVVSHEGSTVANRGLEATLDGELGFHYGLSLADVRAGDSVRIVVESPPQTARHQGYETAFFEMEPLELAVPDDIDEGR